MIRASDFTGGEQKCDKGDVQNQCFIGSWDNPVTEILSDNSNFLSFRLQDGRSDCLMLNPYGLIIVPKELSVDPARVRKVQIYYNKKDNVLRGVKMFDVLGKQLLETRDCKNGYDVHTVLLAEKERIVGYRSHIYELNGIRTGGHSDI